MRRVTAPPSARATVMTLAADSAAELGWASIESSQEHPLARLCRHARTFEVKAKPRLFSTLTVVTPEPADSSRDQLFVDHHPIARTNWRWADDDGSLSWSQRSVAGLLGGEVRMFADRTSGLGVLTRDRERTVAELDLRPVSFACSISRDAGKPSQETLNLVCGFKDNRCVSSRHARRDSYSLSLTLEWSLDSTLSPGVGPTPEGHRVALASACPDLLSFELDALGESLTGTLQRRPKGTTYVVRGKAAPPALAGIYLVEGLDQSREPGLIALHCGRLYLDHQPLESSWQAGNRLAWTGLSARDAWHVRLPASGYLELSPDGSRVVGGSWPVGGRRIPCEAAPREAASSLAAQPILAAALRWSLPHRFSPGG